MERFSTCWADEDKPYLQPLADTPGHVEGGKCFCDTDDKEILSQVLNSYDLETQDFYRWTQRYGREELGMLVGRKTGVDVGTIVSLHPMERGASGRIKKLMIVGEKQTVTVGKELEIRRVLSETHLKSSAFDVEISGNDIIFHGKGWGHGVGLCQIGAAVMAAQGYAYDHILRHYYPGSQLTCDW